MEVEYWEKKLPHRKNNVVALTKKKKLLEKYHMHRIPKLRVQGREK